MIFLCKTPPQTMLSRRVRMQNEAPASPCPPCTFERSTSSRVFSCKLPRRLDPVEPLGFRILVDKYYLLFSWFRGKRACKGNNRPYIFYCSVLFFLFRGFEQRKPHLSTCCMKRNRACGSLCKTTVSGSSLISVLFSES